MSVDGESLVGEHDCLMLDLDGTVFRGSEPTPGAVEVLSAVGIRTLFLTNNASRGPDEVAQHLRGLGFAVGSSDVVTSAQSAANAIGRQLEPGSKVLVVGTDSLAAEINRVGLRPVRSYGDGPVAVVQGHSPHTSWADLAEAALAIRDGALWTATNADLTLPSERGLLPGNGSMVAALRAATGAEPEVVGKPGAAMIRDAMALGSFRAPLVVGDRLDTDIAGANAAGLPSVLVLTGVSTAADVFSAEAAQRPTYLAQDLRCLRQPAASLRIAPQPGWRTDIAETTATLTATGQTDGLSGVRTLIDAIWSSQASTVVAGDDKSRNALEHWGFV